MSIRKTLWDTNWLHVFRSVVDGHVYIDVGRNTYNRAWRIWPPTLKRLY